MLYFLLTFSCAETVQPEPPPPAEVAPAEIDTVETAPQQLRVPFPLDGLITEPLPSLTACEHRFEHCIEASTFIGPAHRSAQGTLSTKQTEEMRGITWKEGCPIALEALSQLRFTHWTIDGSVQWGELIVASTVVDSVALIVEHLYNLGYPLTSAKPMTSFQGNDDASMAANNTSAFNCRPIKGTARYSQHSYGEAIDLNPLWNPWVRKNRVEPPEGKDYANREVQHPGLLRAGDAVVSVFAAQGWKWGGSWKRTKDYQHFSTSGR